MKKKRALGFLSLCFLAGSVFFWKNAAVEAKGFLAGLGGEHPFVVLKQARSKEKQLNAVAEIVARRSEGGAKLLLDLLDTGRQLDQDLEIEVIRGLGVLGYRQALPYLSRIMRFSTSVSVRAACLESIAGIMGKNALPILMKAVRTADFRRNAWRALLRMAEDVRPNMKDELKRGGSLAQGAALVLASGKEPIETSLFSKAWKIGSIDDSVFLRAMGMLRGSESLRWLGRFLVHGKNQSVETAFDWIRIRRKSESGPAVVASLGAGKIDPREALLFLNRINYRRGRTIGLTYSRSWDPVVRSLALKLVARGGGVKDLTRMLDPAKRTFFHELIWAMSASQDFAAVTPLIENTKWAGNLGVASVHGLGNLLRRDGGFLQSRKNRGRGVKIGAEVLWRLLSPNDKRRWAALRSLGRIRRGFAIEPSLKALKSNVVSDRVDACLALSSDKNSEEAGAVFRNLLADDDSGKVRVCAAWALRHYPGEQTVRLLSAALRDIESSVACTASAALAMLSTTRTTGNEVWSELAELLESPSTCLRSNAVWALGWKKDKASLRELRYFLLRDLDSIVKRNAVTGLWRNRDKSFAHALFRDLLLDGIQDTYLKRLITEYLWSDRKHVGRILARKGMDFFAFLAKEGKKRAGSALYSAILPGGLTIWHVTDRYGYGILDDLCPGEVVVKLN